MSWSTSGSYRVRRGGGWLYDPRNAQVADRYFDFPGYRDYFLGLRLARRMP